MADCTAASDMRVPASYRSDSIRARTWSFLTRSPSLTRSWTIRPETLAPMFTKRLGLTSPEAVTRETRSRLPTFWVWTGTFLLFSRATLKPTTLPRIKTTAIPPMIRFLLDAMEPPRCPRLLS